jgi:hypothetical protein
MLRWNQHSDRAPTTLQNVSVDASVLHKKLVFSHHDLYKNKKIKKMFTIKEMSAI